jgi:hypothetical protein
MTNAIINTAALIAALVLAAAGLSNGTSKGINPVQHSEGGVTTQNASKGINPVQHSE